MKNKASLIEKVSWADVRERVRVINPHLFKILETLNPGRDLPLYRASYPFGALILQQGAFHLPNAQGNLVPLTDESLDPKWVADLAYNDGALPLTLILKNTKEVFLSLKDHTISPHGLLDAGRVISTWRVVSQERKQIPLFLWSASSGVRSLFMLPKISEKRRHDRLMKAFGVHHGVPHSLLDEGSVFARLAQSPAFPTAWESELLLFGRAWVEHLNDPAWLALKAYFLEVSWNSADFWHNQFVWELIFSFLQKEKSLRPDPYVMDTVKYILGIAVGGVPGFAPARNDAAAPIQALQDAYREEYRIDYAPIMMQPKKFVLTDNSPVYYSLQYPCTVEFSPSTRKMANKISVLHQILEVLHEVIEYLKKNTMNIDGTGLYEVVQAVSFDGIHTEMRGKGLLQSSESICAEDPGFFEQVSSEYPFPANSTFLQGCIRIRKK